MTTTRMGNRYTKDPFFTRADKGTSVAFPAERLAAFKAAAEAEGISFNRWLYAAAERHMAGAPARARAVEKRSARMALKAKRKAVA